VIKQSVTFLQAGKQLDAGTIRERDLR